MTDWRWACVACRANGAADGPEHAAALSRMHEGYACPVAASDRDEYALRVARRADLSRRYPAFAPPWRGGVPWLTARAVAAPSRSTR